MAKKKKWAKQIATTRKAKIGDSSDTVFTENLKCIKCAIKTDFYKYIYLFPGGVVSNWLPTAEWDLDESVSTHF